MRKKVSFIFLLIVTVVSMNAYSSEIGSKFDLNLYYHPSITLDDSSDLPIYSSLSSTYDFTPLYVKFNNHQIGAFFSIFHVSDSLIYQNEYLRDFSAVGMGIDYGYYFSTNFFLNTKLSMGVGKLGQSQNKELYTAVSIIPSFIINKGDGYSISLNTGVNIIYRKYFLAPSVGIGVSTSFDWLTNYIRKVSSE